MESRLVHGHTLGPRGATVRSATYNSWRSMVSRCTCPTDTAFRNYGAKGIGVCDEWRDFPTFLADMGERPDGMTLDRIDPTGHYEPENCRWATRGVQANNKTNTRLIRFRGAMLTIADCAERLRCSRKAIETRLVRHGEEGFVARWMT